jgi:hypothetical protein
LPTEKRKKIGVDFKAKIEGEITRELMLPAPDASNHFLGLAETKGRNKSLEGSTFLDDAVVGSVESWDLVEGVGPDRGYMTFTVGIDNVVAKYSRRAKPGGGEKYLLSGRIYFLSGSGRFLGIYGRASYSGWASSNKYELNWQGRYTLPG